MSRISQFLNFNPANTSIYDDTSIGEIKIFPNGKNLDSSILWPNNYVRQGTVLSQSEYPELFQLIGRTSAGPITPKGSQARVVKRYSAVDGANVFYGFNGNGIVKTSANGFFTEGIATLPFSITRDNYNRDSFKFSEGYFLAAGELGNLARSTDAITWQIASNTATETQERFNSITYGNGLYVAVGQGELFRYSTDFVTWNYFPNIRANNTPTILASTYGNGVYLQAGVGGFLQSSTDARTWTTRTSGTTSNINALTYGNGFFVFVGNNAAISTSTNGISWTPRGIQGIGSQNLRSITYGEPGGNKRFVVCGDSGVMVLGDGTESIWFVLSGASSLTTTNLTSVVYGNGIWLAAGAAATTLRSTDPTAGSWTLRLNSTAGTYVGSTEYMSPGTYSWVAPANVTSVSVVTVGGGAGGTYNINDNPEQYTWGNHNYQSGPGGGLGWKNNIPVTPGSTYTVVVGSGGSSVGRTYSQGSANLFNAYGVTSYFNDVNTVAGAGGGWNSPSYVPQSWDYSSDPSNPGGYTGDGGGQGGYGYSFSTNPAEFSPWSPPLYAGGGGAGGYSGRGGSGVLVYSANNVIYNNSNWWGQPNFGSGAGSGGYGSQRGGGVGIFGKGLDGNSAAGFGGSGGSTDGTFGGGGYNFGSGASGAVRIIWGVGRSYPSTATGNLASVGAGGDPAISLSYGNGLFVYTSELGRYLTSTDGITWLSRNPPSTVTIRSAVYGNGKYFYGDDQGIIYYNSNIANSLSWIRSSNSTLDRINTITYNNGTYIFAGANTTQNGRSIVSQNGFVGLNIRYPWSINYHTAYYDPYFNAYAIGGEFRGGSWNTPTQIEEPWMTNFRYSLDGASWLPNIDLWKNHNSDKSGFTDTTRILSIESVVTNTAAPASNRLLVMTGEADRHGSMVLLSNTSNQTFSGGFTSLPNTNIQSSNAIYRVKQTENQIGSRQIFVLGNQGMIAQGNLYEPWGFSISRLYGYAESYDDIAKIDNAPSGEAYTISGGSWGGQRYTSNSLSGVEYSPAYNVQSQFIVPGLSQLARFENFSMQSNYNYNFNQVSDSTDYINTANTFYENIFVRAK